MTACGAISLHTYRIIYEISEEDVYIPAVAPKRRELKAGEM